MYGFTKSKLTGPRAEVIRRFGKDLPLTIPHGSGGMTYYYDGYIYLSEEEWFDAIPEEDKMRHIWRETKCLFTQEELAGFGVVGLGG